jgi:hypothetical protein
MGPSNDIHVLFVLNHICCFLVKPFIIFTLKLYMNGYFIVPYKVGIFNVDRFFKMTTIAGLFLQQRILL